MSQQLIRRVKAELERRGVDLSGPCGAFTIVKHCAWLLRNDNDTGLLSKPQGNNCQEYATDILCYKDGKIRDILADGGGDNRPLWPEGELEEVDHTRYRPAIDPGFELFETVEIPNPNYPDIPVNLPQVVHPTYDQYVKGYEGYLNQISEALIKYRGGWGVSDLAHFSYQLFVDGRDIKSIIEEIKK